MYHNIRNAKVETRNTAINFLVIRLLKLLVGTILKYYNFFFLNLLLHKKFITFLCTNSNTAVTKYNTKWAQQFSSAF